MTVRVDLGPRSYDILIGGGLIAEAGSRIAALAPGAPAPSSPMRTSPAIIWRRLQDSLAAAGVRHAAVVVAPAKRRILWRFHRPCDRVLATRMERGDLVGRWEAGRGRPRQALRRQHQARHALSSRMPTQLLAQVDSSVRRRKTGINFPWKNLVGAFHQPALVLADSDCLDTLPQREFKAGYAEVSNTD